MKKKKAARGRLLLRAILIVLAAILILSAGFVGMCMINERPAVQSVAAYQSASSGAAIRVSDDGGVEILPQSGASKTGIVFYVGAQIAPNAYIPLLTPIAEQGYACFIPKLTGNIALLKSNAAEAIMEAHPEIESWILAGHSLGGFAASGFVDDHRDAADGLILIAAYSSRDLSSANLPTLSIFGDADGVMNKDRYEKSRAWNPSDFEEWIIAGANHAQYGDYGKQPRDLDAAISAEEQQARTAEIILDWLNRRGF